MINSLLKIIDETRITKNADMSKYTTFRTGGCADIMVTPFSKEELKDVIKFFHEAKVGYYVLGNGSNILVSDNGLRKPVINIGKALSDIGVFENYITASSGASLASVAKKALDCSLTGFEFAAGIPGTVGGAMIMNAGAYGGEMKYVTEAVSYIDSSGEEHIASNDEMEFSYRHSALSETDCIITGATFMLGYGDKQEIADKMSLLAKKRREKQPLEFPSAGSTFKRPEGNFAGMLIEKSGLKGKTSGGAQVSEKHAGFIINKGGATSNDILQLIEIVRDTVYKDSGVLLEPEVKYWE